MADRIPHTRPGQWPEDIRPTRFASGVQNKPDGCRIGLLGLADDTGVRLNLGWPGAAEGPDGFRAALGRIGAREAGSGPWPAVYDAGDIDPGATLDETHARVTEATSAMLDAGLFPVAIGGGHDLTFPFVRAVAARVQSPMSGVYVDAHLDVRAEPGSGMAFRRLVEDCSVRALHVHGLDPTVNSAEHLAWFESHGGVVEASGPPSWRWPEGELFFSFDLDVIDQAFAPGVSSMNPCGMAPAEALAWARAAGAQKRVRSFDIMELNPAHDSSGRTARLAARIFLEFLRGFAERPS